MKIRAALRSELNGYAAVIILTVAISLVAAGLAVGFRLNRNSEQKFCNIAESFVELYKETPPPTETGKQVALNWERLRTEELHCPVKKG